MKKVSGVNQFAGVLLLTGLPLLSFGALQTPGKVIIDQNGNRLTASINLRSNPDTSPRDIVWTAQLTNSVLFVGENASQSFMCTVDRGAALYSVAVQVRTGFSNGGYLIVTKNAQGQCTSVVGANSSEFFE
jgi:hypothetical protein